MEMESISQSYNKNSPEKSNNIILSCEMLKLRKRN